MGSSFYTNYTEVKFIDKLKRNIDTCKAFYFSVSFIKKPGLRLLAPNIEAAVARGACGVKQRIEGGGACELKSA